MKQIILSVVALALIVSVGVLHGRWTNRWASSKELAEAAARVTSLEQKVGKSLGDWQGELETISPREVRIAGIVRYFASRYQHSGESISALLVCGKPGPISVHLPDMCYESAGFKRTGKIGRFSLPQEDGSPSVEFQQAKFRKEDPTSRQDLRIYWTFGVDGAWTATQNPRFALAGHPAVYKLYVIHNISRKEDRDVARQFMQKLMDELDAVLFESAIVAHTSNEKPATNTDIPR